MKWFVWSVKETDTSYDVRNFEAACFFNQMNQGIIGHLRFQNTKISKQSQWLPNRKDTGNAKKGSGGCSVQRWRFVMRAEQLLQFWIRSFPRLCSNELLVSLMPLDVMREKGFHSQVSLEKLYIVLYWCFTTHISILKMLRGPSVKFGLTQHILILYN